jgi:hypothetical protein
MDRATRRRIDALLDGVPSGAETVGPVIDRLTTAGLRALNAAGRGNSLSLIQQGLVEMQGKRSTRET